MPDVTLDFLLLPASPLGDLPRLSDGPYAAGSNVMVLPRPRMAVSLDTIAFSMLAIDVINCRLGPGDVPVTADAYVVGDGVGGARKALVSLARVREAWYVREGSSRISSRRTCGIRPASKVAMSDVCLACWYGETLAGAVRLAMARRRAYAWVTRSP